MNRKKYEKKMRLRKIIDGDDKKPKKLREMRDFLDGETKEIERDEIVYFKKKNVLIVVVRIVSLSSYVIMEYNDLQMYYILGCNARDIRIEWTLKKYTSEKSKFRLYKYASYVCIGILISL